MTEDNFSQIQENILEACLNAMRDGASVSDCLKLYPDDADWLTDALMVARLLDRLPARQLSVPAVGRIEDKLMQAFEAQARPARIVRPNVWAGLQRAVAVVVLVFALALMGGTGTVMASATSQPTDTLYPVKRAWENVIVLLAELLNRVADVWAHLAQVRYEELEGLRQRGLPLLDFIDDFNNALENAVLLANADTRDSLLALMQEAQSTLGALGALEGAPQLVRMERLLSAQPAPNGGLMWADPAPMLTPTPLEMAQTTATPTPTTAQVLQATATPSFTPTVTASLTPTATNTARFSPTATRTPTPQEPTATATATATRFLPASPTATLTPLPLPLPNVGQPSIVVTVLSGTPALPTLTPTRRAGDVESPFTRPTFEAAYMTQTAEAASTEPPSAP